jgi:diketogulonate reductase-like aldo/keto reductase
MDSRIFGTTRRQVAAIGQGSWHLELGEERAAVAALRRGLDLGLAHIDTAEMYGDGAAERIIGKAIAGRREEVFLVSKVLPTNASKSGAVQACEKTLKRLGTERLDCYLLHWRGRYPLAETVAGFELLLKEGKILSWGVSNFNVADLDEITALGGEPACNQVLYHLQERAIEHAVLPWCERHQTAVVAYTPFGQKSAPYAGETPGARLLKDIGDKHNASARQVALRFLLRHPSVFVIPKAVSGVHVADNAAAMNLNLSASEIAAIDAAFPRGAKRRDLPMI